tara:strand:- start:1389 stop:1814 length:426 start_codon:yes stop_codon:yes gene_type:complete
LSEESGWYESNQISFSGLEWLWITKTLGRVSRRKDPSPGAHREYIGAKGKGTSIGERMGILIQDYDPKKPLSAYIQCNTRTKPIPGKIRWRHEKGQAREQPEMSVMDLRRSERRYKNPKDVYVQGQRQKRKYRESDIPYKY